MKKTICITCNEGTSLISFLILLSEFEHNILDHSTTQYGLSFNILSHYKVQIEQAKTSFSLFLNYIACFNIHYYLIKSRRL
jgi:hypothetical protein